MTQAGQAMPIERVQLGVRMEKRLVKVLKGLAEFEGVTLGQLLEKIVLHSFEAVPGNEGELAASPHSTRALAAVTDLKRVYDLDYDLHGLRRFTGELSLETPASGPAAAPGRTGPAGASPAGP